MEGLSCQIFERAKHIILFEALHPKHTKRPNAHHLNQANCQLKSLRFNQASLDTTAVIFSGKTVKMSQNDQKLKRFSTTKVLKYTPFLNACFKQMIFDIKQ